MPPILSNDDPTLYAMECDLLTYIHPILARMNWIFEDFEKDAALWDDLQPALRLVTQMLTHDSLLLWYTHAMFSIPLYTSHGPPHSAPGQYFQESRYSWNLVVLEAVRWNLTGSAGRIQPGFSATIGLADGVTCQGSGAPPLIGSLTTSGPLRNNRPVCP
jgi:hypothetical protein